MLRRSPQPIATSHRVADGMHSIPVEAFDRMLHEQPLDPETADTIQQCAQAAASMLNLDVGALSPASIIAAIEECLLAMQEGAGPQVPEDDDPSFTLGSLWGNQLVRALGWQWAVVTFDEQKDSQAVGVFSPDRALAIYPLHFVWNCLENAAPVTLKLAFVILTDGTRVPPLPPKTYENVMDHVHLPDAN